MLKRNGLPTLSNHDKPSRFKVTDVHRVIMQIATGCDLTKPVRNAIVSAAYKYYLETGRHTDAMEAAAELRGWMLALLWPYIDELDWLAQTYDKRVLYASDEEHREYRERLVLHLLDLMQ